MCGVLLRCTYYICFELPMCFVSVEHRSVGFVYTMVTLDSTRPEKTDQGQHVFPHCVHCCYTFRHYNPDNRKSGWNRYANNAWNHKLFTSSTPPSELQRTLNTLVLRCPLSSIVYSTIVYHSRLNQGIR